MKCVCVWLSIQVAKSCGGASPANQVAYLWAQSLGRVT